MRRLITFPCAGEILVGSLDEATGTTGLLIVSGGNEIRCGAHRGMALLAAALADQGFPVFRFDRRGIGDSSGENGGFASSGSDVMAAAAAFRDAAPQVERLVGFGNCDAATALALYGGALFDRLILANPWVVEPIDELPPAAAIRSRYAARLRDRSSWARFLTGQVNYGKLVSGMARIAQPASDVGDLAKSVIAALTRRDDVTVIVAERDATAIAFLDVARRLGYAGNIVPVDTDSHSFARAADKAALFAAVAAAIG